MLSPSSFLQMLALIYAIVFVDISKSRFAVGIHLVFTMSKRCRKFTELSSGRYTSRSLDTRTPPEPTNRTILRIPIENLTPTPTVPPSISTQVRPFDGSRILGQPASEQSKKFGRRLRGRRDNLCGRRVWSTAHDDDTEHPASRPGGRPASTWLIEP